jgi:hypothetical protein
LFGPQKGVPMADPDIPKREALNGFWNKIRGCYLIMSKKNYIFYKKKLEKVWGEGFPEAPLWIRPLSETLIS